ncbi:MAG TPA: aminotransferase class I/II-fold pyridoxal phosphate-dependent enzyme [Saprospiraceae bacterium]|nr:aminotransferase class I/II-fold pyridoxal phosphate-dependent enzyme [Saprospiraceae bacterium]HMQ81532.1 aminotransferase class I/II-fold pyridoxal phosphate-dependent enzyme [Saprospiraceae bacterium]
MHLSEIINHLGENRAQYFQAVSPPIIQSSNFAFPTLDAFRQAIANELDEHIYTRGNNPTVAILRQKLAALERAEDALVFGSGMGAISAAVMANVKAGSHVVCVNAPYSWTKLLLTNYLPRFGVSHTFIDGKDLGEIEKAIQPNTSLIYLESPNSMTFELQDLRACAALAKSKGIVTCVDNSYASPLYQQPIEMGVDIVVHSGTKYLNGHSDVVAGVLCSNKAMIQKIFQEEYMNLGGILSPHDAGLMIRGLRTLPLRLQQSNESCLKIARHLEQHPKVERVLYPFLPSFPQYELAQQQMSGAGGLFSCYLRTDHISKVEAFFERLQRFLLAVSWGGHESLIIPMAAFHIPGKPTPSLPWNFVRFYIGLEDPDWLIEDLEQALTIL